VFGSHHSKETFSTISFNKFAEIATISEACMRWNPMECTMVATPAFLTNQLMLRIGIVFSFAFSIYVKDGVAMPVNTVIKNDF